MRIPLLVGCLTLVSACSSYSVRCNAHLHPINVPESPVVATGSQTSGLPASTANKNASAKP
jgi:hypothetical protein